MLAGDRPPALRRLGAALACGVLGLAVGCGSSGGGAALESAPPVVTVEPPSGSAGLSTAAVFRVRFDTPADESTLARRVHVRAEGRDVPVRVHGYAASSSIVIDPSEPLPADAAIEVRLDPGIATKSGTVLGRAIALSYRTTANGPGPAVVFDPLAGEVRPWPSDLFTAADDSRPSGRRFDVWNTTVPSFIGIERDDEMDGFDLSSRMMVALTGAIDLGSLPPGDGSSDPAASMILTVADPSAPGFGVPIPFLARYEPLGLTLDPPTYTLMIRALVPLAPATRHALVLTKRIRGSDGSELAPSAALDAALGGRAAGDAHLDAYAATLRDTAAALSDVLPFGTEDIAGMTVFTTATEQALTQRTTRLIDAEVKTAALVPPRFRVDSTETRGNEVVVRGHLSTYDFRGSNGRLVPSRFASVPVTAPPVELEVLLSLPVHAARAPVTIFGHGIDSSKEELLQYSDSMAAKGLATIGIDFVQHGSRFTGPYLPALSFINVDDLPEMKDSVRQTIADLVQLERCVATGLGNLDLLPLGAPDGVPDLDGGRISYAGASFGGILGSIFVALDPSLRAAALLIAGGTWTDIATEELELQPGFGGFDFLSELAHGLDLPTGEIYTDIAIAQQTIAPGDPLVYARRALTGRFPGAAPAMPLLQIEVIADTVVPNPTSESLARAIAVPQLEPAHREIVGAARAAYPATANGPGGLTVGLVQYRTFQDGSTATHTGVASAKDVHDQVADFLSTALAGKAPTILPAATDR